jgi:hypothetical protein
MGYKRAREGGEAPNLLFVVVVVTRLSPSKFLTNGGASVSWSSSCSLVLLDVVSSSGVRPCVHRVFERTFCQDQKRPHVSGEWPHPFIGQGGEVQPAVASLGRNHRVMVKLGVLPWGKPMRACGSLVVLYFLLWMAWAAQGPIDIIRATPSPGLRSLGLGVAHHVVPC